MKMMVPAAKMVVVVVVVTMMVIVLMIMKVVMIVVMVIMVDAIMTVSQLRFPTGARIQETDIGPISKSSQFQAKINPELTELTQLPQSRNLSDLQVT